MNQNSNCCSEGNEKKNSCCDDFNRKSRIIRKFMSALRRERKNLRDVSARQVEIFDHYIRMLELTRRDDSLKMIRCTIHQFVINSLQCPCVEEDNFKGWRQPLRRLNQLIEQLVNEEEVLLENTSGNDMNINVNGNLNLKSATYRV